MTLRALTTTTKTTKGRSPMAANTPHLKLLATAAIEADRLMESIPIASKAKKHAAETAADTATSTTSSAATTTPHRTNNTSRPQESSTPSTSKLVDVAQQKCALDAATALLAVSRPEDLDLTHSDRKMYPQQVASLHRAYIGMISWCIDVLAPDPTGQASLLSVHSGQGNSQSQKLLWNTILQLSRRTCQLDIPLHKPLYQRILCITPQLHRWCDDMESQKCIVSILDDIATMYGPASRKEALQGAILQWLRDTPNTSQTDKESGDDNKMTGPKYLQAENIQSDGVVLGYLGLIREAVQDDILWDKFWAMEAVGTLRKCMLDRFHANASNEEFIAIVHILLDYAARFVHLLEPTLRLVWDEEEKVDPAGFMAEIKRAERDRDLYEAALSQFSFKYREGLNKSTFDDLQRAAEKIIDDALVLRIGSSPAAVVVRHICRKSVEDAKELFCSEDSDSSDDDNDDDDLEEYLVFNSERFSKFAKDFVDKALEEFNPDFTELYQDDVGFFTQRFPDITDQWKSWHLHSLRYTPALEEVLFARSFPEKHKKFLEDRESIKATISKITKRTSKNDESDDDDSDDSDDDE